MRKYERTSEIIDDLKEMDVFESPNDLLSSQKMENIVSRTVNSPIETDAICLIAEFINKFPANEEIWGFLQNIISRCYNQAGASINIARAMLYINNKDSNMLFHINRLINYCLSVVIEKSSNDESYLKMACAELFWIIGKTKEVDVIITSLLHPVYLRDAESIGQILMNYEIFLHEIVASGAPASLRTTARHALNAIGAR